MVSAGRASVLITAVALLISPSQKNGSRTGLAVALAAGACCADAAWAPRERTRAAPRAGRKCLMAFSL